MSARSRTRSRLVRGLALLTMLHCAGAPFARAAPAERQMRAVEAPAHQRVVAGETSSGGVRFTRVRQAVDGIPVLGGEAVLADGPGTRADLLIDHTVGNLAAPESARVGRERAIALVRAAAGLAAPRTPVRAELAIDPAGSAGRLVWHVLIAGRAPVPSADALVDARTGELLRLRDARRTATGTGRLFDPNPVTAQGDRAGLADDADADSALLTALRSRVELPGLDGGSDCLDGPWVRPVLPSGPIACPPGLGFEAVTRGDDAFEPLMVAFHVERAQRYLRELGFTTVMGRQLPVVVNEPGAGDNSWYDAVTRGLTFGDGGVDDAEDADVIVHEYAHAIQDDQVPGFGSSQEGRAMGEGFGDYLAAALSAELARDHAFGACFAEWDALARGRACLRRTDLAMTLAQARADLSCAQRIHCIGQVWSAALWEARGALGGARADRTVIQSHFALTANAVFLDGARALLAADRQLYRGTGRDVLIAALGSRGLLDLQRVDDTPAEAVPLGVPGRVTGTLDASSDRHDVYRLPLVAGGGIVVRMTAAAELGLALLRPGAVATDEPGASVAAANAAGGGEQLAYLADRSGDHYLDVSAVAGASAYALQVLADGDSDAIPDEEDACPAVSDRAQADWDRDGRGDACDPSARAGLRVARLRGDRLMVTGRVRPSALDASAWHVVIERRACRGRCRIVRRREVSGAVRRPDGRLSLALARPRSGRYWVRAVVRAAGYDADRSPRVMLTVPGR